MTIQEYREVMDAIESVVTANPFINCKTVECVYWCCPGGPLQMALCCCNPVTWMLYAPQDKAKKASVERLRPILDKYGVMLKYEEGTSSSTAIISKR